MTKKVAGLSDEDQLYQVLAGLRDLPKDELHARLLKLPSAQLRYVKDHMWKAVLRRPQQDPMWGEDWLYRIWLAGRGWGKTKTGAESINERVLDGKSKLVALVGRSLEDVRNVMVDGESGLIATAPSNNVPKLISSRHLVEWPNGAVGHMYSSDEPGKLRGPSHDTAWCDELCAWEKMGADENAWSMLVPTMRLGRPRYLITTTPKPLPILKKLISDERSLVTYGTTFENYQNLAPEFLESIAKTYGGRMRRQELFAEILEDYAGAPWTRELVEKSRMDPALVNRDMFDRVVVAIDPAMSDKRSSDFTGIVCAGLRDVAGVEHVYYLEVMQMKASPDKWARAAIAMSQRWRANYIIGEVNQGGDLVGTVLRQVDSNVIFKEVRAAPGPFGKSKGVRADEIAHLWYEGRAHLCGNWPELELQMITLDTPAQQYDDLVDALVYLGLEFVGGRREIRVY